MSEAGRALIVTPVLLKCWLRKDHLVGRYLFAIQQALEDNSAQVLSAIDFIVYCY